MIGNNNIIDVINKGVKGNKVDEEVISLLTQKVLKVPKWTDLIKEYDPLQHPVHTDQNYKDQINEDGITQKVVRISYGLQKLAVDRMIQLCFGTPPKRLYKKPKGSNEDIQDVIDVIENIYTKNRIDSLNFERGRYYFASCEVATIWYSVEEPNNSYGIPSPIKLRCANYSPMNGDKLYPVFDDTGDMVGFSIGYKQIVGNEELDFLDTYVVGMHYRWVQNTKDKTGDIAWSLSLAEPIKIQKLPLIYAHRSEPIWGNTSNIVYEQEWAISRNGNYLRKNSKPILALFADNEERLIDFEKEKSENKEFRSVFNYPKGSSLQYVTWEQAIDNLKFYIGELRQAFFTLNQLPDWSYESMKAIPMSGESRKQLFIDSHLKVTMESGEIVKFLDREFNVIKEFVKVIMPNRADVLDRLQVETIITPFSMGNEKETIENLVMATGYKPIISQKEAIKQLGWVQDVEASYRELKEEEMLNAATLTK